MWKREQPCRSRSSGPGSALELRPRIALPSATGEKSLADLDAAKQHRTIHLLFKPDILTCYQQLFAGHYTRLWSRYVAPNLILSCCYSSLMRREDVEREIIHADGARIA